MVAPLYYTAEMVRALPADGNRYETVRGELLVTPAPRAWHQEIILRLALELRGYVRGQPVGHVLHSPADISWGPDTLVQPDLFVVDREEARTWDWARMRTLLLTVEVLSPSSVRADRFTKRRLFQEVGVGAYWVVDPDARFIEVWSPDAMFPLTVTNVLEWEPPGATNPLMLELRELFREL